MLSLLCLRCIGWPENRLLNYCCIQGPLVWFFFYLGIVPLDWKEILKGHFQEGGLECFPSWLGVGFSISKQMCLFILCLKSCLQFILMPGINTWARTPSWKPWLNWCSNSALYSNKSNTELHQLFLGLRWGKKRALSVGILDIKNWWGGNPGACGEDGAPKTWYRVDWDRIHENKECLVQVVLILVKFPGLHAKVFLGIKYMSRIGTWFTGIDVNFE